MKKSDLKVGDEVVFKDGYADNARGVVVSLDPEDFIRAKRVVQALYRKQNPGRVYTPYVPERHKKRTGKVLISRRWYSGVTDETLWSQPDLVSLNMIHSIYNDEYVAAVEAEQQRKKELAEKTQRYYEERTRTNQEKADKLNRLLGLEDVFDVERYGYSKGSLSGPSWDKIADKLIEVLEEARA